MGILETVATSTIAIIGVGCYSPDLRDCTVSCNNASDCAAGQVCSSDYFCASPDTSCSAPPNDAGAAAHDAEITVTPVDAAPDAPPDAAIHAMLYITLEGKGQIAVEGIGTCDAAAPQNGNCTLLAPLDAAITLHAAGYPDWELDRWTTIPCAVVQSSSCTFVFEASMQVGAKFRRDD